MGITSNDIAAQRAMLERGEEKRKADWKQAERERLRDTFAAAALTGLLAQGDDGSFSEESYARSAYRWADVMLRARNGAAESRETVPVTEPMPKEKRAEVSERHTVPLYRHPQPALTDEERDAIGEAIRLGDQWGWSETLRGLLERLA
jgi:hypothetical protein